MPLTPGDLLSHLVELFDYRVKEVSYVDEGANLLPFLLTKNLKGADVKKEAFQALLATEVKNADKVVDILKRAKVPDEDQDAVTNVLKVLTGLTTMKSLSNKTLGDALAMAELADLTGQANDSQIKVKNAFDFIANKVAIKVTKMLEDEMTTDDKKPDMGEANVKAEKLFGEEEDQKEDDGEEVDKAADGEVTDTIPDEEDADANEGKVADEAEEVNKNLGGMNMDLSKLPLTKDGELDVVALKKAKVDVGTITVVKSLWEQNKTLTSTLDSVNERLNNEVDLRIDKHYAQEAEVYKSLKVEGLKDILKSFGKACPDEYPKLKSLLTVAADAMKPASQRDFSAMGGSKGGTLPSEPVEFYAVCKRKAKEIFSGDSELVALQKYWKTPEGRADYGVYDSMVTNGR